MRRIGAFLLAMALVGAAPAWGNSGEGKGASAAKKTNGAAASKSAAKSAKPIKPTTSAVASELARLQQMIQAQSKQIEAQQKQIEALQHRIGAGIPASSPAAPAGTNSNAMVPVATASTANPPVSATPSNVVAESATESAIHQVSSPAVRNVTAQEQHEPTSLLGQAEGKLSHLAHGDIKVGATFYGFYAVFPKTGFGPQTLDNTDIYPGPGNNGYNEFNINRTYINIFYSPTKALTFRVTPNVFRQVGGASAEKLSSTSATGSSVNGNLSFRLKYAYVDFNTLFAHSKAFGKDKLTFGQQQQPLTDWEEGLYGFRFVNLTPWNYLSLSSTFAGVRLHGPIEIHGKQYLDYGIGVFNSSSFHAYEVGDRKQVMARLSYYPFGAISKYQGLGLTGFVDYGYKDAAPDQNITVPETRVAALAHYQSKSGDYGIAGEYDWGRNAFSLGNLFSGSGPADAFGLGPTRYAAFTSLAAAILSGTHTRQMGFDFFGHARIPKSPFYLFGMFEQFDPNTNISNDPLKFRTVIAGLGYKYNKYWEFAIDSKNILYYQSQFTFPVSQLALFSPSLAAEYPNGIPNAVPTRTNEISFNVLFNY